MSDQIVRRARPEDAAAIAGVWLRARRAAPIPAAIHSDDEVRGWVRDVLLPAGGCWVGEEAGEVVAMMVLEGEWVEQLYVSPEHQQRGHGSRLLELAKASGGELTLWTFESNLVAQRFYEAHGFIRDGAPSSDNEERSPAVRYRWWRR